MVPYLKNLCQLHLLVVKDGMDTVHGLLGLVRCSPLGFLMQDRDQSPDGNRRKDIWKTYTADYSFYSVQRWTLRLYINKATCNKNVYCLNL